jgi:hypothetical protein
LRVLAAVSGKRKASIWIEAAGRAESLEISEDRMGASHVQARMTLRACLLAFALFGVLGCKSAPPTPAPVDPDVALRARLAEHRAAQMERLHAYAALGEFPHNTTSSAQLHMFRDTDGRYCAIANLVHQDGRDDLVEATVRGHNDLEIRDVHDGPMMAWILDSGLTQEELVRIQYPSKPLFAEDRAPARPTPTRRAPTPVDEVAKKEPKPDPRVAEEAMKAEVRANLAQVEADLRAHGDESLRVALERAHTPTVRVASR